ncbi:MAG: hypothetical protein RMI32_08580, partial [Candidatus Nitrosocaldus sp.]|nr:hypothetical protein [Candidatus Nitrosocaldus sp.]
GALRGNPGLAIHRLPPVGAGGDRKVTPGILRAATLSRTAETSLKGMSEDLYYLLGASLDAYVGGRRWKGEYVVEFYQKSRHWLTEEIAPRLRALGFSYRVKTYKGRYHRLVVYSKRFHDLLWQAWKTLPNSSREELISFVKGVADAEASVHRKYNRIVVWQKNQDTLEFVRAILEANGIKCGKFTRSRDVLG